MIFFPLVSSTENKIILNVNKIQFILEKERSRTKILESILPHLSLKLKNKINTLKKILNIIIHMMIKIHHL